MLPGIDEEDVTASSGVPLAARMRPRSLADFVGQDHIVGPGRVLRRSIEGDRLPSMILWGPPGSGKTTLARVIAESTHASFVALSAVTSGVADLRKVVDSAKKLRSFSDGRTVLFIDEIHRFNKAQQDAILPHVEDGTVIFIGATTENPSFQVNAALLSRCRVFHLEQLDDEQIMTLVRRALLTDARMVRRSVQADDDTLDRLVRLSGGDARVALTALELAVEAAANDKDGAVVLSVNDIEDAMQRPALLFDRAGEMHFDLISAFIKSLRGSDPDAAVYWLARMLEAGEDPMFVARRMVILAAEDVGLADPQALIIATACQTATHQIGMPEAYLPLTECALYLALAPKSNSVIVAYQNARQDVMETLNQPVPLHLRNAVTSLARSEGYGKGYKYAHDFDQHVADQQYLPDLLAGKQYYESGTQGDEGRMNADWRRRREKP
jgi:putative ATPase